MALPPRPRPDRARRGGHAYTGDGHPPSWGLPPACVRPARRGARLLLLDPGFAVPRPASWVSRPRLHACGTPPVLPPWRRCWSRSRPSLAAARSAILSPSRQGFNALRPIRRGARSESGDLGQGHRCGGTQHGRRGRWAKRGTTSVDGRAPAFRGFRPFQTPSALRSYTIHISHRHHLPHHQAANSTSGRACEAVIADERFIAPPPAMGPGAAGRVGVRTIGRREVAASGLAYPR